MLKIEIIAVNRIKKGAYADLVEDFSKRIRWPITIIQIEAKSSNPHTAQKEELEKIGKLIKPDAIRIVMDESGKSLSSREFSQLFSHYTNTHDGIIQFIIGGSDGLNDEIRKKAHKIISFGKQTWPHLLARVMLLEQIYRAQQILANHPYHRD